MRIVKLGLISVVFLFLVVTAISLLLPSSIIISRAVDINADITTVYPQVADLTNWKSWYANSDTASFIVSSRTTGKGAILTLDKSTITFAEVDEKKIKAYWSKGAGTQMAGEFNFITAEGIEASHITVQWQIIHTVQWYPWEKFASIVVDKSIGSFMEKSLDKLKAISEGQAGE